MSTQPPEEVLRKIQEETGHAVYTSEKLDDEHFVAHDPLCVDRSEQVRDGVSIYKKVKVKSISAHVREIYLDRPVDYDIEYGNSESSSYSEDDTMVGVYESDIYIDVRTTCWAKIDVRVQLSQDEYKRTIYETFKPFDYDKSSSLILSRINLEGEIPIVPVCIDSAKDAYVDGEIEEEELETRLEAAMEPE